LRKLVKIEADLVQIALQLGLLSLRLTIVVIPGAVIVDQGIENFPKLLIKTIIFALFLMTE